MKNRLQEMRWEKNWSQTQLAMRSNVPRSTIGYIENNQFVATVTLPYPIKKEL